MRMKIGDGPFQCKRTSVAFTLMEVMIATFIFFTAVFAILTLTTQNLRSARILKQHGPSIGKVAGELVLTNKLEEGVEEGDFSDDGFRDYKWARETKIYGTNGLFQVDIVVFRQGAIDSSISLLLYRPDSQAPVLRRPGQ
jgi:hypothetical protein